MHNLKTSRKISPQLIPATGDEGRQQLNADGHMGKKRDRLLRDTTNVSFVHQVQQKKKRRKPTVNNKENEQISPHALTDIDSLEPGLWPQKVQEPKTKPLNIAYPPDMAPCDLAKFKKQGHLFTRDYFFSISEAMT